MLSFKRSIVLLALLILFPSFTVRGEQCPAGSEKIGEETVNGVTRIHCKCLPGRVLIDNECLVFSLMDLPELIARRGRSFQWGKELRALIRDTEEWATRIKTTILLGAMNAERGMYNRSIRAFEAVRKVVAPQGVLLKALRQMRQLQNIQVKRGEGGPLVKEVVSPEELAQLSSQAAAHILVASASLAAGDYQSAGSVLDQALRITSDEQGVIRKARIYVAQLQEAQEREGETETPREKFERYKEIRAKVKADAAWNLGFHLTETGDYSGAIHYFKEAQEFYSGSGDDYGLLQKCIDNVHELQPIPEFPTYPTKADAILDALEYGKGNWDESVRYLETAHKADPANTRIRDALNHLRGIQAGLQFRE